MKQLLLTKYIWSMNCIIFGINNENMIINLCMTLLNNEISKCKCKSIKHAILTLNCNIYGRFSGLIGICNQELKIHLFDIINNDNVMNINYKPLKIKAGNLETVNNMHIMINNCIQNTEVNRPNNTLNKINEIKSHDKFGNYIPKTLLTYCNGREFDPNVLLITLRESEIISETKNKLPPDLSILQCLEESSAIKYCVLSALVEFKLNGTASIPCFLSSHDNKLEMTNTAKLLYSELLSLECNRNNFNYLSKYAYILCFYKYGVLLEEELNDIENARIYYNKYYVSAKQLLYTNMNCDSYEYIITYANILFKLLEFTESEEYYKIALSLYDDKYNDYLHEQIENELITQYKYNWDFNSNFNNGFDGYCSCINKLENILAQNCVNLLHEMSSSGVLLSELFYGNVLGENELTCINNDELCSMVQSIDRDRLVLINKSLEIYEYLKYNSITRLILICLINEYNEYFGQILNDNSGDNDIDQFNDTNNDIANKIISYLNSYYENQDDLYNSYQSLCKSIENKCKFNCKNLDLNQFKSPVIDILNKNYEIAVVNIDGKIVYQFSTDSSGTNDILSEQILHYLKNNTAINSNNINSFKSESRSNLENEIKNICFDFKNINFEYAKTNYDSLNIYLAYKHKSDEGIGNKKLDGYVYDISGDNNIDAGWNGLVSDKQIDNGAIEEAEDDELGNGIDRLGSGSKIHGHSDELLDNIFNGNGSNKYNNNYNNTIYDIISAKNYDDNKGLRDCTLNENDIIDNIIIYHTLNGQGDMVKLMLNDKEQFIVQFIVNENKIIMPNTHNNHKINKKLMDINNNMKSNHLVCINNLLNTTTETPTSIPVHTTIETPTLSHTNKETPILSYTKTIDANDINIKDINDDNKSEYKQQNDICNNIIDLMKINYDNEEYNYNPLYNYTQNIYTLQKSVLNYWYVLYSLQVLVIIVLICTNKWWNHWLFIMSFILHFVWLIHKIFHTFIICNSSKNHKHSNKQSMTWKQKDSAKDSNTSHEVEVNPIILKEFDIQMTQYKHDLSKHDLSLTMDNSCEMLDLNSNGNSDKQNKLLSSKIITIFVILVCGTYEYCQCLFRKLLNISNKIGHYNDNNVINIILDVERLDINKLNNINIKEEINFKNITPKQFVNDINNPVWLDAVKALDGNLLKIDKLERKDEEVEFKEFIDDELKVKRLDIRNINEINHINSNIKNITSRQFINMICVLFE